MPHTFTLVPTLMVSESDHVLPLGRLSLRRNAAWTFVGNVVYAGTQFGMIALLARWGSEAETGLFDFGLTIAALVVAMANLFLRGVQATDARREFGFAEYLALRLVTSTLAAVTIATIAWGGRFDRLTAVAVLLIGLVKSVEAVSDIYYGLFQQRERMDFVTRSLLFRSPLSLALFGGTYWLTADLIWACMAWGIATLIPLLFYDIPYGRRLLVRQAERPAIFNTGRPEEQLRRAWNLSRLLSLARVGLPVGLVTVLMSLQISLPRFCLLFLEPHFGMELLGVFGPLARFSILGTLVVQAVAQSAVPRLSQLYASQSLAAFRRLLGRILGIAMVAGGTILTAAWLWGEQILALLKPTYAQYTDIFLLLMAAGMAMCVNACLGSAVNAMRRFGPQLYIHIAKTCVLAALCWMLIARFGLHGAAWAVLISTLVTTIAYAAILFIALRPAATISESAEKPRRVAA